MSTEAKQGNHQTRMPGNQAVRSATGHDWKEWFEVLDQAGAERMDHKGIVAYLKTNHAISPWWQQQVTVSYEQMRGLRQVNEMLDGYQISRSKTIPFPVSIVYEAWA